jgi:uncharacterized protein (DUF1778 family)
MADKRQRSPLAVRFNETDLAALNQAAAALGVSRNSLVVNGARLFVSMALSAANAVSADNAALPPVLTDLNSTAGDGQGRQGPEGKEGKSAPDSPNSHAPRVSLG